MIPPPASTTLQPGALELRLLIERYRAGDTGGEPWLCDACCLPLASNGQLRADHHDT